MKKHPNRVQAADDFLDEGLNFCNTIYKNPTGIPWSTGAPMGAVIHRILQRAWIDR